METCVFAHFEHPLLAILPCFQLNVAASKQMALILHNTQIILPSSIVFSDNVSGNYYHE